MNQSKTEKIFRRLSLITLISVYFLILVGGIVRSTGSGMGCPDWPKCFGSIVPPTHVSELPANYKEIYANQRQEKNIRFVKTLKTLGFDQMASRIESDKNILVEQDFNATKTWIEYINRLIGAVIGLLIFATFLFSLTYWKKDPLMTILSFITLILVGFQGWIGSIVVSTNLLPGMITFHMLLALLIVSLLLLIVFRSRPHREYHFKGISFVNYLVIFGLILMALQISLGTQVREEIDTISGMLNYEGRESWIGYLGRTFYIHRSFSLLIFAVHAFIAWKLYKQVEKDNPIFKNVVLLIAGLGMEIVIGAFMAYFAIPPYLQPMHLILAILIFGNQCYLFFQLNYKESSSGSLSLAQ